MSEEDLRPRISETKALKERGYIISNKIGSGSYANVYLAEYYDQFTKKHQSLACKIFNKKKAPPDFLNKFFPRELDILTKVDNPHVIQIHSILQRGPRVFIFMRHAENGDLLSFIKRNGALPEINAREWFRQIAIGLQYLHNKQIAHRDLKCENILISKRNNVKLADFGFARYCMNNDGNRILSHTYCGSAAYAAPEVVSGTPYNPKLADIWSLGVILYIMLNSAMPFDDSDLKQLLKDQLEKNWAFRPQAYEILSQGAKIMIQKILEPDLTIRYNLEMILSYNWLKPKATVQSKSTIPSWPTVIHEGTVHHNPLTRWSIPGNSES